MTRTPAAVPPFPERMEGEGVGLPAVLERLQTSLAKFHKSDAGCPVRGDGHHWMGKRCARCGADDNGGCGLEIAGAYRAVNEMHDLIMELKSLSITREQEG